MTEKKTYASVVKKPHAWNEFLKKFREENKEEFVGQSGKIVVQAAAKQYQAQKLKKSNSV